MLWRKATTSVLTPVIICVHCILCVVDAFRPTLRTPTSSSFRLAESSSKAPNTADEHEDEFHHLYNIRRIFCLSDLHTDHVLNQDWLRERMHKAADKGPGSEIGHNGNDIDAGNSLSLGPGDLLVIAGDISHDIDVFLESITYLKQTQCTVFFVAGNHEAWLSRREKEEGMNSIDKIENVYRVCRENDVLVDPCYIHGDHPLVLLPVQSWYDGTLSFSEELCKGFEYWPWVDFIRCQWPSRYNDPNDNSRIPKGLVEYFLQTNQPNIRMIQAALAQDPECSLITISHFLPNQQSLPDWNDLTAETFQIEEWTDHGGPEVSAKFAKVAGSKLIDEQIRNILQDDVVDTDSEERNHIHIFGHSHRPKDFLYKGIRYIHNPLGKPRERQLYMVAPEVDFQLVWNVAGVAEENASGGMVEGETILRYWDEKGGGKEALWRRLQKIRPNRYGKYNKRTRAARRFGAVANSQNTITNTTRAAATEVLGTDCKQGDTS